MAHAQGCRVTVLFVVLRYPGLREIADLRDGVEQVGITFLQDLGDSRLTKSQLPDDFSQFPESLHSACVRCGDAYVPHG